MSVGVAEMLPFERNEDVVAVKSMKGIILIHLIFMGSGGFIIELILVIEAFP